MLHHVRSIVTTAFQIDRIHVRSGFLALWCLEAVVPLFALVAALAEGFGLREDFLELVRGALGPSIFGSTSDSVLSWLTQVAEEANWASIGLFGSVSALFVGYQLYAAVLFDLGELYRSGESERSWLAHGLLFVAFLVWSISLVGGGAIGTAALLVQGRLLSVPLVWLATTGLLTIGPKLFGRAEQDTRSLLFGAMVGATWMEIVKVVFVVYSTSSFGTASLTQVYQQLAFAPLAMLWMHLIWFSTLLASVVTRHLDAQPS